MALVNIVRSGGDDTHDMALYLAHTSVSRRESGKILATSSSSASASISAEGEIGDVDINSLYVATAPKVSISTGTSANGSTDTNTTGLYCVECEDKEEDEEEVSQQIVPVGDLSGALPFNQRGVWSVVLSLRSQRRISDWAGVVLYGVQHRAFNSLQFCSTDKFIFILILILMTSIS